VGIGLRDPRSQTRDLGHAGAGWGTLRFHSSILHPSGLAREILGQAGWGLTNVKLNDGRQEIVAIQVHHLVPGGYEILDELLV
jgi:hypothetical protein